MKKITCLRIYLVFVFEFSLCVWKFSFLFAWALEKQSEISVWNIETLAFFPSFPIVYFLFFPQVFRVKISPLVKIGSFDICSISPWCSIIIARADI